jgi:hypothetical protein
LAPDNGGIDQRKQKMPYYLYAAKIAKLDRAAFEDGHQHIVYS